MPELALTLAGAIAISLALSPVGAAQVFHAAENQTRAYDKEAQPEIDALRDRAESNGEAMHELDVNDSDRDARLGVLATEKGAIATEQARCTGG